MLSNNTPTKAQVVLRSVTDETIAQEVESILSVLNWTELVQPNCRVTVKLNLSSIEDRTLQASNTDNRITEALCKILQQRTQRITLVESDGMRYTAEDAFAKNGIYALAEKIDVNVVNLSRQPQVYGLHPLLEKNGLPQMLLEDTDLFITLPVLKTHALTAFTGSLKNQWGCVPQYDRILLHKNLDELLPIINRLFKPGLALMDGIWGMEGRGPTNGKPRYMGVILGSRFPASLDATAMRLIGLEPTSSKHIRLAPDNILGPIDKNEIEIDGDFGGLQTQFEPAILDWAVDWMNELSRFRFFVHQILLNKQLFSAGKATVQALRGVGVVR